MASNSTDRKKALKKIIIAVIIAFAVLLVLLGALYLFSEVIQREKVDYTEKNDSIFYFSADYSADPDNDLVYAAKDKEVFFTDHSGFGEYLTEADGSVNNVKGLMYNYFNSLKNGDAQAHNALLSAEYKRNFVVQERFTPQKVYDIKVDFLVGDGKNGVYIQKYSVSYKIYKNDGTYRADIGSDVSCTMVFEVVNQANKVYINSIVENISKGDQV